MKEVDPARTGGEAQAGDPGMASELGRLLEKILKNIIHLPWLHTDAGGIFINHPEQQRLELVAHVNFSPFIQGSCARVAHGRCLCGQVAVSGRTLHVDCVDHRHEVRYEGMADHGHYVLPIRHGDDVLGVMVLYVAVGHQEKREEVQVLEDFADTIANLILATRLRHDKALADLILEHSAQGVLVTDENLRIEWVNPAFERMTGYTLAELRGQSPSVLRSEVHDTSFFGRMWDAIHQEGHWEGEIWNRHRDGSYHPHFLSIVRVRDSSGRVVRYAGTFVDLTEIRAAERRIHRLAYFDKVTGLPNTEHFHNSLGRMLASARHKNRKVLVAILDLDHFHEINESLGHRLGNVMLSEFSSRLRASVPKSVLARLGADQFAIAKELSDEASREPLPSIESLAAMLDQATGSPLLFEHQEIPFSCTMGIALSEAEDRDPEAVSARALVALRHAKDHCRGGYRIFDEEVGKQVELSRFITTGIARAIRNSELYLVYQPQVDADSRLLGAEVLLRWNSPSHGFIPPSRFIPIAEEKGKIIELGLWVFENAIQTLSLWQRRNRHRGAGLRRLAINVSPVQLMAQNLVKDLCEVCQRHGVPTGCIELEITETGLMHLSDRVISHLHELNEAGFHIAIDDFGTGFSSLARLHQFPLDILKIDRSFVMELSQSHSRKALVRSIIDMAHALGYEVVAEGVEDREQYRQLRQMGCDLYQGYLFGRPMEAVEFHASCIASGSAGSEQAGLPAGAARKLG